MSKTIHIRKPKVSLEAELMDQEAHAQAVTEQAVESQAMDMEIQTDAEETDSMVASLESRMDQLEVIASFAGKPIQSFEQAQLTTALAYTAINGTDLDVHADVFGKTPSQFNSSFESSEGLVFSGESIGQTIKDMASAAGEKLKQAGKWLYELVVKVINIFRSKETRIKNLKALTEKAEKETKLQGDVKVRLTGSQVANVGTVGEYNKLLEVFKQLNGASPKFVELLDTMEKLADKSYMSLGSGLAWFNKDHMATANAAVAGALASYQTIFGLKFTDGGKDELKAVSPLVGKRKIQLVKSKDNVGKDESHGEKFDYSVYLQTVKFSLVKDENTPETNMANVLSIAELKSLTLDLESAIAGKIIDLRSLEKLAKHRIFTGKIWSNLGDDESSKDAGRALTRMGRAINDVAIRPHGLLISTFQSVTDDYLRYSEVCAKMHASGKEEVVVESGSTDLVTA